MPDDPEYSMVTFVYRGDSETRNVLMVGGIANVDFKNHQLTHLQGTDVWYKTYRIRSDARFTYTLSVNDPLEEPDASNRVAIMKRMAGFKRDPLNPKRFDAGMPGSVVELPKAPSNRWTVEDPQVPKGQVAKKPFESLIMKVSRPVTVYTPAGFDVKGAPYPLAIVFDGEVYTSFVPGPVILDNLIANKAIPPVVAVFVHNSIVGRMKELGSSDAFVKFLADELVPWMRQNYNATNDPAKTLVAGSSLGGLAAAFAAFRRPDVFGNVLSQSGSYWRPGPEGGQGEWLTGQYRAAQRLPVRFYLNVGLLEYTPTPGDGPTQVEVNRRMRDALVAKGYKVRYREVNGGHEYFSFRATFGEGLEALFGRGSTD